MVKRRAISREDKALEPKTLPHLYQTLVPLVAERHANLYLGNSRSFEFARTANAVPLTAEEFPMALRHYPIVFSDGALPMPLALVGVQKGVNDFVEDDGSWKTGTYIPAYLRRYPFAFVKESAEAERNILCADLSSVSFVAQPENGRALFENGKTSQVITDALEFCNRYETALARTRAAMSEFAEHELIGASTVTIAKGGKSLKIQGFQTLSEEKLRELPDDVLADFVRRGLSSILSAHFMSLSNFSVMAKSE
jgi:hypothetical protein